MWIFPIFEQIIECWQSNFFLTINYLEKSEKMELLKPIVKAGLFFAHKKHGLNEKYRNFKKKLQKRS